MNRIRAAGRSQAIAFRDILELLKPVTWFAPVWAFGCGLVAGGGAGASLSLAAAAGGLLLAGPLVCGASQAANDWFDRHVDAVNEPHRPIPSGRLPGRTGLIVAVAVSLLALVVAAAISALVLAATALALLSGWAYSAPPMRLKANGLAGVLVTGISYEGLAWLTGALVAGGAAALSRPLMLPIALLYSLGAAGIMVLNDFKAVEGDRQSGIRSLPAMLGIAASARLACWMMALPQLGVIALLAWHGLSYGAVFVTLSLVAQAIAMRRMASDPRGLAPWYNQTGVTLFVAGMMASAIAIRTAAG